MGRMRILIWDITRLASSAESQTSVKAPTRSPKTASKWPRLFQQCSTTTTQKACFSPDEALKTNMDAVSATQYTSLSNHLSRKRILLTDHPHDRGQSGSCSQVPCPSHAALTVEAHVLSKRLRQRHLVSILDELPQSESILVDVTAGKTLVGHVKEGEQLSLLDDAAELHPLLWLCGEGGREKPVLYCLGYTAFPQPFTQRGKGL